MEELKEGIISVFKPKGISSFDVIRKLRKITGIKKIGHAGTLDPLATGVLVVGIGQKACRDLNKIVNKDKEYLAEIKLGASSSTDDAEGDIKEHLSPVKPNLEEIKQILEQFKGKIHQKPPIYSAIKHQGQPAYKLARQGQTVPLKPRLVELKQVEIISANWPFLKLRLITGPGFYVRALARDLGIKLKTKAYLFSLERIRVGEFKKESCFKI
jgi:tRNA pseudouridine55 synthase